MNGKETFMVETLTRELITRLMEERSLTMREAMDIVYNSRTFTTLNNLHSGLYFQSPAYVYDVLEEELKAVADRHTKPSSIQTSESNS